MGSIIIALALAGSPWDCVRVPTPEVRSPWAVVGGRPTPAAKPKPKPAVQKSGTAKPRPKLKDLMAVPAAKEMTEAEALAIDRRFMEKNHYRLCPGSCGMMCSAHGGGWVLEKGPADPSDPYQRPAPDTPAQQPASCAGGRCGPGGCPSQSGGVQYYQGRGRGIF